MKFKKSKNQKERTNYELLSGRKISILTYNSECIHFYTKTRLRLAWLWFSAVLQLEASALCTLSTYSITPALVSSCCLYPFSLQRRCKIHV